MRKTILLLVMALTCMVMHAQELKIKSFERDLLDLTASTSPRKDANDQYCGLVKVFLPRQGVTFEGNVVGNVSFNGSEYRVYLTAMTRFLKIACPGFKPMLVQFNNHGIAGVECKATYIMDIDVPGASGGAMANERPKDNADELLKAAKAREDSLLKAERARKDSLLRAERAREDSLKNEALRRSQALMNQTKPGTITVKGKVVDEYNEPLIGVAIYVVGTSNGAVSDIDGNFTLKGVAQDSKIRFYYIGCITQTLMAAETMRVKLKEDW